MTKINYSEDYVINCIKSQGCDVSDLSHNQISFYKSTLKKIEADLLIEKAFEKVPPTSFKDVDCSIFMQNS